MEKRRFTRRAGAVAIAAPIVLSCSSLLGVDDYHDSASELCDLLGPCYGIKSCEPKVAGSLNGATAGVRSEWLRALSDKRCLDNCKSARRCLDVPPVCAPNGTGCSRKEECCGFLAGGADCRVKGAAASSDAGGGDASAPDAGAPEGPKQCCKAEGASCSLSADCCVGSCDPHTGTCGKPCRPAGEVCSDNFDCCTRICREGKCSEDVCVDLGGVCATTEDCCQGAKCLPAKDGKERCGYEQCQTLDQPCGTGFGNCCDGQDLDCLLVVDPLLSPTGAPGVCRPTGNQCFPNDYPCAPGTNCCSGFCDPNKQRCGTQCKSANAACSVGGECCSQSCSASGKCDCSSEYCTVDADCCSNNCAGGLCGPSCAISPPCDHDECIPGGPLDPTNCATTGKADPTCVTTVCSADKYCCCVSWDTVCAAAAVTTCGQGIAICN